MATHRPGQGSNITGQNGNRQNGNFRHPPFPSEDEPDTAYTTQAHPARSPMASSAIAMTLPSIPDRPEGHGRPGARPHWSSGYGSSPGVGSTNGYGASMGVPIPPPGGYSPAPGPPNALYPPSGGPNMPYSHPLNGRNNHDHRATFAGEPRPQSYYGPQPSTAYNGGPGVYDYNLRQDQASRLGYLGHDYPRGGPPAGPVLPHGQSAPRQRTSIACKYCRRRKIRCSGYANSPGGKCTNCFKMNQDCVFQPVSSTSSTAFVPVSALPGGVPPGVPLFGAYGQPLTAGQVNFPVPAQNYPAPPQQHFEQPLPSPTGSNGSYWEDRSENGMRRPRAPEEEHGVRLPPPSAYAEENARHRSASSSSPGHLQPYQASQTQQPVPHPAFGNRTPPRGSPSGGPTVNGSSSSVMNIENLMTPSASDIDKSMLGRLNRRA